MSTESESSIKLLSAIHDEVIHSPGTIGLCAEDKLVAQYDLASDAAICIVRAEIDMPSLGTLTTSPRFYVGRTRNSAQTTASGGLPTWGRGGARVRAHVLRGCCSPCRVLPHLEKTWPVTQAAARTSTTRPRS
jgi:hypothetical protein